MLCGNSKDSLPNKFAEELTEKDFDSYKNDLVFLLHEEGINVRYLGIVYEVHNITYAFTFLFFFFFFFSCISCNYFVCAYAFYAFEIFHRKYRQ